MRLELISLVLVLAIAGGLVIGGGISGEFFTSVFSGSPVDSQVPADEASKPDTSGFGVKMKTTGSKTQESAPEPEEEEEPEETTSPPITGFTGGGGGKGGGNTPQTICSAGTKRCEGDILQQCSSDGLTWNTLSTCVSGCDPDSLTCNPGTSATITVDAPETVSVGSSFTVSVNIDTDAKVYAIGLKLKYNETFLKATEAEPGSFLREIQEGENPVKIKDSAIEYRDTRRGDVDGKEGVSGSGELIIVEFEALTAIDSTKLSVENLELIDDEIEDVEINSNKGATIHVTE
jgi:hypothetical protein